MNTIYKYPLQLNDEKTTLSMSTCSQIVHVGMQDDTIHVWATHNTVNPLHDRTFRIVGTGHPIYDEGFRPDWDRL